LVVKVKVRDNVIKVVVVIAVDVETLGDVGYVAAKQRVS
jgi:hypothetical protein